MMRFLSCLVSLLLVVIWKVSSEKFPNTIQTIYKAPKNICGNPVCAVPSPSQSLLFKYRSQCVFSCLKQSECRGFNWKGSSTCELFYQEPTLFTEDDQCTYYYDERNATYSSLFGLLPCQRDMKRTVVFFYAPSYPTGQDVFFRGGIDHSRRTGCTSDASTSNCAISIVLNPLGDSSYYDKYNAWRIGNTKLNWYGAQAGQGLYQGIAAQGSPSVWTTNNSVHPGYQPDNAWGDSYWKFDVMMNCTQGEQGWFELRSFTNSNWDAITSHDANCTGSAGGVRPYTSTNHLVRCGYQNIIALLSPSCVVSYMYVGKEPASLFYT